jgi:shikimate dehydrogenase
MSVTIPHKEHAARWLEEQGYPLGEIARRCGAVNTLVRTPEGGWRGENTDALGVIRALTRGLEQRGEALAGSTVDVLGAGGVARAAVAALVDRGCHVTVYNRRKGRAEALAQSLRCAWQPWGRRTAGSGRILVNCTSVGMQPDTDATPIAAQRLRPETLVFDTIYNPAETRLLRAARDRGCQTISGVELFIAQASEQFTLWHQRPAPEETMRRALSGKSDE